MCYLQVAAHIPQMKLPPSYTSTFQLILGGAVIAVLFPLFTRRAIRRAREGKMGLGENGRKAKMCSKEGLYMLSLNIISNTFFFGVMVTLVSAFACGYDRQGKTFMLLADPSVECFSLDSLAHTSICLQQELPSCCFTLLRPC